MRIVCGVLLVLLVLARPVHAAPNYRDFEGQQIHDFEVKGVPSDLEKELKNGLSLGEPAKLLRSRSTVFRAKDLEADRQRTLLFLAQRGYPRAAVDPVVTRAKGRKV